MTPSLFRKARQIRSTKNARAGLAARYLADLRAHLARRGRNHAHRAGSLGRSALAQGLVTLDVAIMHERAVLALAPAFNFAQASNGRLKRAGLFFTQVLVPLEVAQRATRANLAHLQQNNATLRMHTATLARGNRRLKREVARREAVETALVRGRAHYRKLFVESQLMEKKLHLLTRQIISAQEEERKEISRELHDEVVQTLVGINVELAALTKGTSDGLHNLKSKIARTQRLVENSVNAVHRFARELRPAVLDDLGLIPALHTYSRNLAARKKIRIHLTAFGGVEAMDAEKRTVLFRVAQEALTNVVRHARATEVRLGITRIPGAIRMEISDNGKSFAVRKTLFAKNRKRLGLLGMQERIKMVGGRLAIESAPTCGTTIRAEIPFNPEKNK